MKKKGVDFEKECQIFEVCNPHQAKRVVFTEGGKVKLATLKPTALISQFHTPELQPVAKEVEETLIQIMNEASE